MRSHVFHQWEWRLPSILARWKNISFWSVVLSDWEKSSWLAWLVLEIFGGVKNAGFPACVCFFQYYWNKCFCFGCEITRSKIPCNCKDVNVHEGIFQDAPFRSPQNASFMIPVVPSDGIPERGKVYPRIRRYNCITQKSALVTCPVPSMYGMFTYIYLHLVDSYGKLVGKYTSPMDGMGIFLRFLCEEVFRALGYSEDRHKSSHPYCHPHAQDPHGNKQLHLHHQRKGGQHCLWRRQRFFWKKSTLLVGALVSQKHGAKTWTFGRANWATFKLSVWHSVKPEDPIKNGMLKNPQLATGWCNLYTANNQG